MHESTLENSYYGNVSGCSYKQEDNCKLHYENWDIVWEMRGS